jgi:hypothetical protein
VGWEVHQTNESHHAARLVRRTALAEGIVTMAAKPVLHGDNGSTLKATTVLAMRNWLGIKPDTGRLARNWRQIGRGQSDGLNTGLFIDAAGAIRAGRKAAR